MGRGNEASREEKGRTEGQESDQGFCLFVCLFLLFYVLATSKAMSSGRCKRNDESDG